MRIAVVGGSLAVLFTATLLAQDGHDVTVYERSLHGPAGRGAGFLGKRESFAILRASGCEHVARVGVVARERIVFGDAGTSLVQPMPPQMQISWDTVYRVFRERRADGTYLLGKKVEHLREDADRVVLRFENGNEAMADLVVGADGVASVVRAVVDGPSALNCYAGYVGWRGLLAESALPGFAGEELLDRFAYFRMPYSHIIGFLVPGAGGETESGRRRYNWVWYRPAAGPAIRRLPQRCHRVLDRRTISTLALSKCLDCSGPNRCASPECAHRTLTMPTRRRAQLVEDAPLLRSFGRPVTRHHRRQHLTPRAHADLSRHRGHRTNLVALLHSSARSCPVTFCVRQCVDPSASPSAGGPPAARYRC
ncbi:FAD binding domain-containing protein [Bradyrhizobium sp. CCBAU 11386]|uniref:FAD binding domain-containing protein n=1 Tax=Bradyrhizobium sp. CCBAU 11386 TaxID=1630837 RepID=UPI0023042D6F|nr:FAD-dependent monooxygenase [Bradyrhizobium sp. CCBAU 11386]